MPALPSDFTRMGNLSSSVMARYLPLKEGSVESVTGWEAKP